MNDEKRVDIDTLEEFLVHALELEEASVEHYEQLADSMEVHNNIEVAELFRKLAGYSQLHAQEVHEKAKQYNLPQLTPWDFKWRCPTAPESFCCDDVHHMMTTSQAIQVALFNETRGREFYQMVADHTHNEEVRKAAQEMAEEEAWHERMLSEWHAELDEADPLEDFDPPNMPE